MTKRKLSAERRAKMQDRNSPLYCDIGLVMLLNDDLDAADAEIAALNERLNGDVEFLQKILTETEAENEKLRAVVENAGRTFLEGEYRKLMKEKMDLTAAVNAAKTMRLFVNDKSVTVEKFDAAMKKLGEGK